jgi:EAL domain-containing protein (putative c-di-GMP-specific phosphodiesterase class I)
VDSDRNSRVIAETISDFAKKLGIKTVAEFVHSKEVLEVVKEVGIDYSQGFFLGKPSSKAEIV